METKTRKVKEIKIPGPDHPITISPAGSKVRVTVAGKIVAESTRALRLDEKGYPPVYYLPRDDADMSLLVRTTHYTYCPYKGECTYLQHSHRRIESGICRMKSRMRQWPAFKSIWRFVPHASMQSR